jgi:hypothetical protein
LESQAEKTVSERLAFVGFHQQWLRLVALSLCNLPLEDSVFDYNPRSIKSDRRPPILYLRPFKADDIKFVTPALRAKRAADFRKSANRHGLFGLIVGLLFADLWAILTETGMRGEELLIEPFEALGPVFAIGRPGEKVPPLGAARVYAGEDWQDKVHDFVQRAQLILLFAGTTRSFAWEIEKVFRSEPFVPALMMIPFFREYSQTASDEFGGLFQEATGHRLPHDLFKVRAAYFPDRDSMIILEESGIENEDYNYYNPFLGAIAHVIDAKIPGWSFDYLDKAYYNGISDGRRSHGFLPFLRSDLARALDTILRPHQAFEGIRHRVNWWVPFLVLLIASLTAAVSVPTHGAPQSSVSSTAADSTRDQNARTQLPPDEPTITPSAATDETLSLLWATSDFEPFTMFAYAWIVWAAFKYLFKAQVAYAKTLAVAWYAALPWALHTVVWMSLSLLGGQGAIDPNPFRAGAFTSTVNCLTSGSYFLFKAWSLALMMIGMTTVSGKTFAQTAYVIVGLAALPLLALTGFYFWAR